jgi:hypothetical protein
MASQIEMYEKQHFDCGQKLAKARKIREEMWHLIDRRHLEFGDFTERGLKAQLTKIIKKHL